MRLVQRPVFVRTTDRNGSVGVDPSAHLGCGKQSPELSSIEADLPRRRDRPIAVHRERLLSVLLVPQPISAPGRWPVVRAQNRAVLRRTLRPIPRWLSITRQQDKLMHSRISAVLSAAVLGLACARSVAHSEDTHTQPAKASAPVNSQAQASSVLTPTGPKERLPCQPFTSSGEGTRPIGERLHLRPARALLPRAR